MSPLGLPVGRCYDSILRAPPVPAARRSIDERRSRPSSRLRTLYLRTSTSAGRTIRRTSTTARRRARAQRHAVYRSDHTSLCGVRTRGAWGACHPGGVRRCPPTHGLHDPLDLWSSTEYSRCAGDDAAGRGCAGASAVGCHSAGAVPVDTGCASAIAAGKTVRRRGGCGQAARRRTAQPRVDGQRSMNLVVAEVLLAGRALGAYAADLPLRRRLCTRSGAAPAWHR